MDDFRGAPPAPPPTARPTSVNASLVALLLVAVAALMLYQAGLWPWGWSRVTAEPRPITPRGDLADDEKTTIDIFREASPSVVHITSLAVGREEFNLNPVQIEQGTGTGFIWDTSGHVVTNYHVVRNAQAARVTLADNSVWDATLVGYEPDKDIAVLRVQVPKAGLRPIPIGTSKDLQVGQKVFAIGNPFGLDHTLTSGVISGVGREIPGPSGRTIAGVIQTDAAINPGNSGGPLLDSAGRLIGMNTAIYSTSGSYAGVGFAVPVDAVNTYVPQLIKHGKLERPGLGIAVVDDTLAERLGVKSGVLVGRILEGSVASRVGMKGIFRDDEGEIHLGDVIVAVDGKPIKKTADLFGAFEGRTVGDEVTVTVRRDGEDVPLKMPLQAIPRG